MTPICVICYESFLNFRFELIGMNEQTCEVSGAWGDLSVNSPYCVGMYCFGMHRVGMYCVGVYFVGMYYVGMYCVGMYYVGMYCVGMCFIKKSLKKVDRQRWISTKTCSTVDPARGLIIVPKKVWDTVNDEVEFIDGGFPIATFFVDVAPDAYCVDDSDCRLVFLFHFHFLYYSHMVGV